MHVVGKTRLTKIKPLINEILEFLKVNFIKIFMSEGKSHYLQVF